MKETKQETYTRDLARSLIDEPTGFVIKLNETLYGLKQAAQGWYTTMTNWFINNGYQISNTDPWLLTSNQGDLAFTWVNNVILVGENTNKLISKIGVYFKFKDLGTAQHILGIKINYLTKNKIFVNQEHYIKNLVEEYGLEDGKPTRMPMQSNVKLIKSTPQ